ncbi:MAG TPA: TonB-dependent receptor [Lutibacter sp.]|nr:TonB-dependent receptor [Lutibacter sp.]
MKYISILLMLVATINSFSQEITQNIKGKVIDQQSEYPLMGAEIVTRINNQDYWAVCDENGNYRIENVPIGKINIQAHYSGFNTQSFTQLNLVSGKELVVNFSLLEKLEGLDEVIIKAKTKRDNVTFVTTSAASFNVEQTDQYAGSLNDVSRMAMNYAGVSGNDDSRNDIIVRGNNPASLLWVIEGASVPSPNHYSTSGSSGGPVSMLNINTLSRSDFLSGAFPANFGNTTSAAFDLQFKKPNNDQTEFVGQIGFAGLELGVEGPFSKNSEASYLLNYRYSTLAVFDALGLEMGLGTAIPKYQDINAIVHIPTDKSGTFKLWAIGGISRINFENKTEEDQNNYIDFDDSELFKSNNNILTGLTHQYFFNKKTSSKISISYSNIDEIVEIDTLNTADDKYYRFFKDQLKTTYSTVDAKINSKLNAKNQISGGVSYTNYGIDFSLNLTGTYESSIAKNTGLAAGYFNWQHRFSDDFVLNSGLRYQFFTLNNQGAVEPRIGLKYQIKDNTSINLGYGLHSNIHPLLSYFTKQEISPTQYEFANTDLSFVKSHHFIVGMNQKIGEKINLKAEIYYQYLFDVPISHIDPTYSIINSGYNDPGGAQLFYDELFNEGAGKNYGLDITLEYPLNNGFYTLLTGSLYESKYLAHDNVWRNTAWNGSFMSSLLTGKEFKLGVKSAIGIDVNLNYAGGRRATPVDINQSAVDGEVVYLKAQSFENKLPDYFRTDIKISYKLNGKKINQEWQFDLRNAFNRKNVFSQNYNISTNEIDTAYQTGLLPVMQYRILF